MMTSGWSRRWSTFCLVVGDVDHSAHPGVNTTLKPVRANRQVWTSGCGTFLNSTRVNEIQWTKALRRWYWITREAIEHLNNATTKLSYLSKGVIFTAAVFNEGGSSNIELHLTRLVAPLVHVLSRCQFFDELIKGCVAVTDTSAGTDYRVK